MIKKPQPKDINLHEKEFKTGQTLFGLKGDVKFCSKCIISNQRPNSEIEYKHVASTIKKTIHFDENGICDACNVALKKKSKIDWDKRKQELVELCKKFQSNKKGKYDCIVPGSGGKDSFYTSHILKYEYGMNPLTVTWSPNMYTDWGRKNMDNWTNSGFDNILFTPDRKVQRLLTRLSVENLFHPFQAFQLGQKSLAPKLALELNINLIFYGENQAEYGNSSEDLLSPLMSDRFFSSEDISEEEIYLGGVSVRDLKKNYGLTDNDLNNYLPLKKEEVKKKSIEVHFLSHYLKWHPQANYYYAVKHGNFFTSPERMPGTYTKFVSNDDKMEDFNYYTQGIKYGIGWTSYVASWEIRDGDLTREEGISLAKKYDLEFPSRFSKDLYDYISLPKNEYPIASKIFEEPIVDHEYFINLHDKFRSPHLWKKEGNKWELRHKIWEVEDKRNASKKSEIYTWKGNKENKT
jgi:N-acetyl sugar amidotransferase